MLSQNARVLWFLYRLATVRGVLPPRSLDIALVIEAFDRPDPFLSAAALLRIGFHRKTSLESWQTEALAAYRLHISGRRLFLTAAELRSFMAQVATLEEDAMARRLLARTVPISPQSVRVSSPRFALHLCLRGRKAAGSLALAAGECHLLYTDQDLGAHEFFRADGKQGCLRVPQDPLWFQDLSVETNERLFRLMAGHRMVPSGRTMLPSRVHGKTPVRRLELAERFLCHLSLVAALDHAGPVIVEKPDLSRPDNQRFWSLAARVAAHAPALLVLSRAPSDLAQADRVTVMVNGRLLGGITAREVEHAPAFLWVRCRVMEPSRASGVPAHDLRTSPARGDIWLAVPPGAQESEEFRRATRKRLGIVLDPSRAVPAALEDRVLRHVLEKAS